MAVVVVNSTGMTNGPKHVVTWSVTARLAALAFVAIVATGFACALSSSFTGELPLHDRPIPAVLATWGVHAAAYLAAIPLAVRLGARRSAVWWVLGPSLLMRAMLLPTAPILEIDLYRYIWDGHVTEAGVSPFWYAPEDVRSAIDFGTDDPKLRALARTAEQSEGLRAILRVVHFGELTSPYPAVSQAVFYAAAVATPNDLSVGEHLFAMKVAIVVFDVGTLLLLMRLLIKTGLPVGWAIAYGWCPLVLKEFANSAHLDSIAVFFSLWAVSLCVPRRGATISLLRWTGAAGVLALAVGAKIYPLVFGPVLIARCLRQSGWRATAVASVAFVTTTGVLFAPMITPRLGDRAIEESQVRSPTTYALAPPADAPASKASDGLQEFLKRWEINDLLFALVIENIKPQPRASNRVEPWFSVVPHKLRTRLLDASRAVHDRGVDQARLLSRAVVASLYLLIVAGLVVQAWRASSSTDWLRTVFATIAWLWMLAPTQNPWYWTWAIAFLPWSKVWVWRLLGGLPLVYYFRFWCEAHDPKVVVGNTTYTGVDVFDFLVVWLEYAPFWLLWLWSLWHQPKCDRAEC